MNENAGFPDAEVAVAVVMDQSKQILWTWNDNWCAFTLPMTKIRSGQGIVEPARYAAIRAAAEALGVPAEVGQLWATLPMTRVSDRDWSVKHYTYHVFPAEAHADFAARICIRQPHIWLPAHAATSGLFRPLSHSAKDILRELIKRGRIEGRKQGTCVLIVERRENGMNKFLLRWNPAWGFALPTKRKPLTDNPSVNDSSAVVQRILSDELGLKADAGVACQPASIPIVLTFSISRDKSAPGFGAATDYTNWIFEAKIPDTAKLDSAEPLAWVSEEEIRAGVISPQSAVAGSKDAASRKISPMVFQVLSAMDKISWHDA